MALLEIKDIHKSFGNLHVLKGIDLTVNKGDVIAILGPSGSGKTTLLRCMNYLETADAGTKESGKLPEGNGEKVIQWTADYKNPPSIVIICPVK